MPKYTKEKWEEYAAKIKQLRKEGYAHNTIRSMLRLAAKSYTYLRRNYVKEYRNCIMCGQQFVVRHSKQLTCSKSCSYKYKLKKQVGYECRKRKLINQGIYEPSSARKRQVKDREFTDLSNQIICINDFECYHTSFIASLLGRSEESIKQQIKKLKATGIYDKIINIWSKESPLLYQRALRKRKERIA